MTARRTLALAGQIEDTAEVRQMRTRRGQVDEIRELLDPAATFPDTIAAAVDALAGLAHSPVCPVCAALRRPCPWHRPVPVPAAAVDDPFTTPAVARLVGVRPRTVADWCRHGAVDATLVRGRWHLSRVAVVGLVAERFASCGPLDVHL